MPLLQLSSIFNEVAPNDRTTGTLYAKMLCRLTFIVLALVLTTPLFAQSWVFRNEFPKVLPGDVRVAEMPDSLLRCHVPREEATVEDLMNATAAFQPIKGKLKLDRGREVWLRGRLTNGSGKAARLLLEADKWSGYMLENYNVLDWSTVDLYLVTGDSIVAHQKSGSTVPPAAKPVRDARNLFWVELEGDETVDFLIRFQAARDLRRVFPGIQMYDQPTMQQYEGFIFKEFEQLNDFQRWPMKRFLQLQNCLEFVLDTSGTLSFQEVQETWDDRSEFIQYGRESTVAKDYSWGRIRMINLKDEQQRYLFDIGGHAPRVEAYVPDEQGGYRTLITGTLVPESEKQIVSVMNLIDFQVPARDTSFVYFRSYPLVKHTTQSVPTYFTGVMAHDAGELFALFPYMGIWKGFLIGIMLFQVLFFALRSMIERSRMGIYYTLFVLGMLCAIMASENILNTGFAVKILDEYTGVFGSLGRILLTVGLFYFANEYLALRRHMPRIWSIQLALIFLIVPLEISDFIVTWFVPFDINLWVFHIPIGAIVLLLIGLHQMSYLVVSLIAWYRRLPHAQSFLLAFSPFFIVAMVDFSISLFLGILPNLNVLYVACMVTNVLFAVVVGRRNNESREKELKAESLIKLNEAKSKFYDGITHEFRTPLTVIKGTAKLIDGHEQEKSMILKNSQEVLNLVDQLMSYSRHQLRTEEHRTVVDNIVPYLEYLKESVQLLADDKAVDLRFESLQEEIVVEFDREQIRLIVYNLLSNALRYTEEGGSVTLGVSKASGQLILAVKDTGIGIDEADLDKIFERHYQVAGEANLYHPLGGVGLANVKELVEEQLGGHIEVRSTKGEGSTFAVTLPLESVAVPELDSGPLPLDDETKVVLVVEDSSDIRFLLSRLLSPAYKVVEAADGQEGLYKATSLIPDLIISDVAMPEMDGYELTGQLKGDQRTCHIPVILLTAKDKHDDKIQGLSGGADAYLVKPFDEEELLVRVQKLIEGREQLKATFSGQSLTRPRQVQDPFLKKALTVLEEHYQDDLFGISEFGDKVNLSRMQVHRKLKALTGNSTTQFINQFRLAKGKELLERGELNVSEVAYSCGFSDPGYFSRLFSRAYGESPQHFLPQQQGVPHR